MKKIISIMLVVALALVVSACANGGDPNPNPGTGHGDDLDGSLESILERIYSNGEFSQAFEEWTVPGLIKAEITAENCEYHLGKSGLEFEEAIVSEHEMSPSAYALCLVRAKDGADIEKLKQDIRDNIDPMKWVCVGVDPSNIIVDNIGDVIILIMSDTDAQALHSAFLALGN